MSITISTCDQISKSPLNTSKSKMLWGFPKQERFRKNKNNLCQNFYTPGFIFNPRSTSFGFGKKYDFSKTTRVSPPCNAYNLKSEFQPSKSQRKGFGFGKGRQQMNVTGPLAQALRNRNPGPGTYQPKQTIQKSSFSFTSRRDEQNKQKNKMPGPGFYPVTLSINKQGKYPVSKIKNILVRNFKSSMGRTQTKQNRGPQANYDLSKTSLSAHGKYPLSKMQNCTARRFGTGLRSTIQNKKQVPGPGFYRIPSQFGYYVAKGYQQGQKGASNKQNLPAI